MSHIIPTMASGGPRYGIKTTKVKTNAHRNEDPIVDVASAQLVVELTLSWCERFRADLLEEVNEALSAK